MLNTTINTRFVPGTNLSGGFASADWRFLLPRLRFDRVLCLGALPKSSLPVLNTMGALVVVVCKRHEDARRLKSECEKQRLGGFRFVTADASGDLAFAENTFDLVYELASRRETRQPDVETVTNVGRILRPDGIFSCETRGLGAQLPSSALNGFTVTKSLWLTPFSGKMRTAVPLQEKEIAVYFFSNVLYGNSWKKRGLSRVGKALSKTGLLDCATPRKTLIMQHSKSPDASAEPPDYLKSIAKRAGIELTGYRFGLSTRGLGNSNKAIFYLFKKSEKKPETVIKITRAPEFNYRLENEYRLLALLKENAYVASHSYPEPLFLDYHNDLALLGMRAVEGDPFRKRTEASPNCSIAQDALKWIVQVGSASADANVASPSEVGSNLRKLFKRFDKIYDLSDGHRGFLRGQIEAIACNGQPFPLVLQHGDPGTWNMLVSPEGKVIVIDWEAGELKGMPLWDLFYFFRTYASWVSRVQGSRDSLKNFSDQFLEPSELSRLLLQVTARYCLAVGLDGSYVEPLFYTCWMHRALKESTRLTKETLDKGNYINLLRLAMDKGNVSTLEKLFSLHPNKQPVAMHTQVILDEYQEI